LAFRSFLITVVDATVVLLTRQSSLLVFSERTLSLTMRPMELHTPETRPIAPGVLGVLQQFINSGHLGSGLGIDPETALAVRQRTVAGEHQASLAKEFGLRRALVSALGRGAPMFDELSTPGEASEWLRRSGLLTRGEVDGAGLSRLHEFRELLRRLAVVNAHGAPDPEAASALSLLAAGVPLAAHFEAGGSMNIVPRGDGAEESLGRLLITLYDTMRDGSWRRLKRCPGTGCPFTFYDSSRNRTAVWCSMSVCGNRAKVRNYQERSRGARSLAG
jgi:predicted RNA-binding Zn ribbon-like protein